MAYRPRHGTSVRSTLGWGFRGPSIAEIYTNATFSAVPIVPNPDLRAEHSLSCEIGANQGLGTWVQADVAAFYSRYSDLIEARPDVAGVVSFRNVSKGRIAGVEASLLARLDPFRLEGTYTRLDAKEHLPDGAQPLPYRPDHIASGALGIDLGPMSLESRLTYRSEIRRASGLFPEGARDLVAVYLLDFSCSVAVKTITITLRVDNSLQHNYAKVERNLGEPRRLSLGISGSV